MVANQKGVDMAINFSVNGKPVSVNAPESTRLLWVLREELKLSGTKFGCGAGQCGACMVHIDGERMFSCLIPVSGVKGKAVTTIEGLSPGRMNALQRAWLAESVPAGVAKAINAWAILAQDGTVYIMNPAVEMGQGSQTAIPLIIAEEMDADWSRVVIVPAAPDDKIYGNPGFRGLMYTAGSATVTGYWDVARTFGAQVRRVMMENAANKWGVPLAELSTEPSAVVHAKTGRRMSYGEIAAFARIPATAPAINPEELKQPGQYRLIGKDVMRVELPSKVNGTAQYSIDVQLPGMLYGAILRGPVEGTSPLTVDDARARAVPGVARIVRLPFGVGVIAE